jgi:hypothetical protein
MSSLSKPLIDWLRAVLALVLSDDPLQNMLVFSARDAQASHVDEEQLGAFLNQAFHEYCKKAAKLRRSGWFYAWYDEMSGTIRCSFFEAASAAELPFRCKVVAVDDAKKVAALALSSPYAAGIPRDEFGEAADPFADEPDKAEFELTVFARRALTSV